ncbi:hypothetical protein JRQ81_011673 [Phrynocephalus forsythii]|uniref:Uncharacterized protein n=1 Tax=Phrynocephalus forsythii TaxID=171643 RepID=A0A9Q0X6B4_9SAUR|nr:hypothetical protein JRQ81_011673 [Phrynocephalus forsythii]
MPSSGMAPQLSQTSASDETRPSLFGPLKKFYLGEPLALGVKGMLGMNVVGALGAAIGIVILSLSILFYRPYWSTTCRRRCVPEGNEMCLEYCQSISDTIYGMQCILLAFNILEFCIAFSASVFGCRTVCRDSYADTNR